MFYVFLDDIGIGEGFDIFQLLIRKQKNSTVKQTKDKQLKLTAFRNKTKIFVLRQTSTARGKSIEKTKTEFIFHAIFRETQSNVIKIFKAQRIWPEPSHMNVAWKQKCNTLRDVLYNESDETTLFRCRNEIIAVSRRIDLSSTRR